MKFLTFILISIILRESCGNNTTRNTSFLEKITEDDSNILKINCGSQVDSKNYSAILKCLCDINKICATAYCPFGEELMIASDQLMCMNSRLDSEFKFEHNNSFYLEDMSYFFFVCMSYRNRDFSINLAEQKVSVTSYLFMGVHENEQNASEIILLANLKINNKCFHEYLMFQKNLDKYPGAWKHMSMSFKIASAICMSYLFVIYAGIKEYRRTYIGKFILCHIVAHILQFIIYIVKTMNKGLFDKDIYEMLFVGFEYSKFLWVVIIAFHTYKVISWVVLLHNFLFWVNFFTQRILFQRSFISEAKRSKTLLLFLVYWLLTANIDAKYFLLDCLQLGSNKVWRS